MPEIYFSFNDIEIKHIDVQLKSKKLYHFIQIGNH